jgi:hypothetical protein
LALISGGLLRLCTLYARPANHLLVPIWQEAVKELDISVVKEGFLRLEKLFKPTAACPFPTPAHLLELVDSARSVSKELEAERAWQALLGAIDRYYHPDIGWKGPHLGERFEHAARSAGGVHYISQCSEADLVWAKKRFTECYLRDEQLERDAPLLEAGKELRKLISAAAEKRELR